MSDDAKKGIKFLQWALPELGYRWDGFRKPREQVLKRIRRRMQELELNGGFREYREYLEKQPGEWQQLDRLCDVTISKFFRDRKTWIYLRNEILPRLISRIDKPVTCWSLGCCNGEEPYSIAMICKQLTGEWPDKSRIAILSSDRNKEVMERARKGIYPSGALKELRDEEVRQFFHIGNESGEEYRIDDRLKQCIEFEYRDIRESLPNRIFDLVFCRNLVFTYFSLERQRAFLEELKPRLSDKGFLVAGSNEEIPENDWLESVSDTHSVYRRKDIS